MRCDELAGRVSEESGRIAARRAAVFARQRDALLLLDANLEVVDDNGVLPAWLGLPPAPPGDLLAHVHPEDVDLLFAAAVRARAAPSGWASEVRVRMRHTDGTWRRWAVVANNQLHDPDLAAVVVHVVDVTGTTLSGGLTQPESLLREAVSHAPIALLTVDPEGVIRFAGGTALRVDPEQLVGTPLLDLVDAPDQVAVVRQALLGEDVSAVMSWAGRHWQARYSGLWQGEVLTAVVAVFTDVTTQVVAERTRAAGEAHLRAVIEAAREAIIVLDADGRISSANARCSLLFGAPLLPGMSLHEVLDERAVGLVESGLVRRARGEAERYELPLHDATGALIWLLVSASPMLGEHGDYLGSVAVLTDITANKAVERRLEAAALTDPVTGIANRVSLADRLGHALARRRSGVVAVLFCDVDELKVTNDRLGHAAGDELLRHVARQSAAVLRPADSLARYAGDEFVIVCEDLHNGDEARQLAERVRAAVASPLTVAGVHLVPTVSIGVALSPPCRTAEEILAAADAAAYAAKRAGRNAVHLAGP